MRSICSLIVQDIQAAATKPQEVKKRSAFTFQQLFTGNPVWVFIDGTMAVVVSMHPFTAAS